MSDNIIKSIKEKEFVPQLRTETQDVDITLEDESFEEITVYFQYRYYNIPIVQDGISHCIYKDTATSTNYTTHFVCTLKDFLYDEDNRVYVGCHIYVGVKDLPNKVEYPIHGNLPLLISGQGIEKYFGRLEDAVPVIPDGTFADNELIIANDPPPAITGLTLVQGAYLPPKSIVPVNYIKASWDTVIHNDLTGYESDISETDNLHYDGLPDPKYNSATYMNWNSGIKSNTTYYVRVRSVDLAGNTSAWVESHIAVGNYDTINPPTNFTVANHPPFSVWLSWIASTSDNVLSYQIERKTGVGGTYAKIAEVSTTFYVDQTVSVGVLYYYKARAVSTSKAYSTYTTEVSITPTLLNDTSIQAGVLYNSLATIDANKLGDNAVIASKIMTGAVTALKIHTGALLTYNVTVVNRLRKNEVTALTSSNQIYIYGTAVLVSYNGSAYVEVSISVSTGGYVGLSAGSYYYAYFTPATDANGEPLSTPQTISLSPYYPTGLTSVCLGVTKLDSTGKPEWTPYNSMGTIISGDHIVTGSIVADRLVAGTIIATSACIASLDASKLTVGTINSYGGYSWLNLNNGQFSFGNGLLTWNGSNLSIIGSITIMGGSGYSNLTDKPSSLSGINYGEGTKLSGIATGATVGATWGTNLYSIPATLGTPSGSGLFLSSSCLGFYDYGTWKTYMDNTGNFYLGGINGKLQWNGTTLSIIGGDIVTASSGINVRISPSYAGQIQLRNDTTIYGNLYNDLSNITLQSYQNLPLRLEASTDVNLVAGTLSYIYANRSMILASGAGVKFVDKSLWVSGNSLMFGNTVVAAYS